MRRSYLVCYDISDEKRLRHVADVVKAYGVRIQFSVFRCELTPMKRTRLEHALEREIHHLEDQVLFVDLGPIPGRGETCITALGRPYTKPERNTFVF